MKFISVDVSDVDQVHTVRNLRKRKFEFLMKHRPSYRSLLIEQNYPDIELESLKKKNLLWCERQTFNEKSNSFAHVMPIGFIFCLTS